MIHCLQQSTDKVVDWSAFLLEDEEDGGDDDDVLHLSNHLWYDVDGDGEDDGAVVLRGDAVQRLKVSQLKIQRWNY